MKLVIGARRLLIRIAKVAPFLLCFIVCISHIDTVVALFNADFIDEGKYYSLDKGLSEFIGGILCYDWLAVIILGILALAFETCSWNKLCVIYLGINFLERYKFEQMELYPEQIYYICAINILESVFLTYIGIRKMLKKCKNVKIQISKD